MFTKIPSSTAVELDRHDITPRLWSHEDFARARKGRLRQIRSCNELLEADYCAISHPTRQEESEQFNLPDLQFPPDLDRCIHGYHASRLRLELHTGWQPNGQQTIVVPV